MEDQRFDQLLELQLSLAHQHVTTTSTTTYDWVIARMKQKYTKFLPDNFLSFVSNRPNLGCVATGFLSIVFNERDFRLPKVEANDNSPLIPLFTCFGWVHGASSRLIDAFGSTKMHFERQNYTQQYTTQQTTMISTTMPQYTRQSNIIIVSTMFLLVYLLVLSFREAFSGLLSR